MPEGLALPRFDMAGETVTPLDLKPLLVGSGVRYPAAVYEAAAGRARLEPPDNPYAANCFLLPGEVAVHLAPNDRSPFSLEAGGDGSIALCCVGSRVTEVSFPAPSDYGAQRTSSGTPFGGIAVLEGRGILAFFYLWGCQFVRTREVCAFCHQAQAEAAGLPFPSPTGDEVAEVIRWSLDHAGIREVQMTGGTLSAPSEECARYARLLRTIDQRVGLDAIPGEVCCYMSAPKDPAATDPVFEAGADRIVHDLQTWDAGLRARFSPGHSRVVDRPTQLRALEHIAARHGPNRACSTFVVGLEPLDSLLEGAAYLAERGIVPSYSILMPPAGLASQLHPNDLAYHRRATAEYARLYKTCDLTPPGLAGGAHVCMCHDIYRFMDDVLESASC
ncbi:MAG TPA: radical SAM protein [Chthonomonadales bacterium]|nr:radical SAM protein [Chthonomonadales bacterium]